VGRALSLLTRGTQVSVVADEVGYSRRRLSTLVRDEVGVTPQELRRIGRFERSHAALRRQAAAGPVSISDVAADCGYADHAHLTREWARLAGCSPTTWLATEFPIVQALGA
jgi:AraC-like DNA-binding protein